MKAKTKLITSLIAMCLVLTIAVIGILAVTSLNMKIGGNISFSAEGVSFKVSEGKFYEDDGTTLYTGITSQTNIMQEFSMDTDTKLSAVTSAIETWSDLELGLDNRGDAILKFNIKNDMPSTELYVLFTVNHGINTNNNMRIIAPTSEKLAGGTNKDVIIKFDIIDHDINASLNGFKIEVLFSEPVNVNGTTGSVENQQNLKYSNVKYILSESEKTASVTKSSDNVSGEIVIMDKVYVGQKEYLVTSISDQAFFECDEITKVIIPATVTTIGEEAFYWCFALAEIEIPYGVTEIGWCAFEACSGLKSINIPDSVTYIAESAFQDCINLSDINFPPRLTTIEAGAFYYCSSFTNVKIPHGVTSIGETAFGYCTLLKTIEIPSTVTSIGEQAFVACENLESIIIKCTTPPILLGQSLLEGAPNALIYVPAGSVNEYRTAPNWSAYANRIIAIGS